MSSDKFIKMRIKEMILNEKVATYGRGAGNVGAAVHSDLGIPSRRYGPGQEPLYARSTSYADAIRNAVGFVAPVALIAIKTVQDLGTTAVGFGRMLFSGVGSIFSGEAPNWSQIARNQRQTFASRDAAYRRRVRDWGPDYSSRTPVRFLREQYERSNAGNQEQANAEADLLVAVDADLETFLLSLQAPIAARSVDELVSLGTSALHMPPTSFSTESIIPEEPSPAEERQEVERRMLPYMKVTFLSAASSALENDKPSTRTPF